MATDALQVDGVHAYYGHSHVLHGISLRLEERRLLALLGRNSAGKTTTIMSIAGLLPPREGSIRLFGQAIEKLASEFIARAGVRLVPQGWRIFPSLTVQENLALGFTEGSRLTNHYFNNVIGNPIDTTIAVSHLIFDGVVARNPKIKFITSHGGGYIAHYWARMDHAWSARPDCRTVIKRVPSTYLEKFYFDTITFDPLMLKHLIDRFGADHVMLGTDYPYDMGEEDPRGLIKSVKRLAKADRELIEGGNAMKLLKIK